tara:strand:+ start:414 stop:674 length:261 start_codon:yes stop_codon:yes gene_type:complete
MNKYDEEIKINFGGSFVHPNYIEYCLNTSPSDWNKDAQTEAVRVWQISNLLPNLTADVILGIVKGTRKYSIEDETLVIHEKVGEEE